MRTLPRPLAAAALCLAATAVHAAPVQWTVAAGGNDHWYEYVSTGSIFTAIGFDAARAAAQARTFAGHTGYLATVTSAAEQAFIQGFPYLLGFGATGAAWLGASDAAVEGEWRWLDGPEAGQLVGYTNWALGQPLTPPAQPDHDWMGLHINAVVQGAPVVYSWTSFGPRDGTFGYVVEYGSGTGGNPGGDPNAVPEPPALPMAAAALLAAGLVRRRRNRSRHR